MKPRSCNFANRYICSHIMQPSQISNPLTHLSSTLFWDVDMATLDIEKHAAYIVGRVMMRGTLEDFQLIKTLYGKPKLKQVVKQIRYMDVRTLHFCSIYFKSPIEEFRCYKQKQLNPSHWDY